MPQRPSCEMALFLRGSDVGHWVRPVPVGGSARAFRFRWYDDDGRWATCRVTRDESGARCTCPRRGRCEHIRALRAFRLID